MKKKFGDLIFQIIPVMIGVYLGFIASNWSENNQRKHQSKVLVDNLLTEIETNEERLKSLIDYHTMLRDSCRFYAYSNHKIRETNFFKGTRMVKLTNSAYNTGIQTGVINELNIEKIQSLNQLYTLQFDYNEFGNLMMSSLINKDFSDNEENMKEIARFLSVTMTDVVIKENDLIERYGQIKNELNNRETGSQ